MSDSDSVYMRRCIELGARGRYTARSNPLVGAVIVKHGNIIAEGWHVRPGLDHAEIVALKKAGADAAGATLYVSLEPCSHVGRTGPCCDAVIAAGVSRVVYGMIDPNPRVSGRGVDKISEAGIELTGPLLDREAAALNPGFIKRMQEGLPLVRCKLGMSLDGRTAMASGESKWITGEQARDDVQLLRAASCAVMTGIETVLADDPGLDVRRDDLDCMQPLRVVVDSRLRIFPGAKILRGEGEVLIATAVTSDDLLADKAAELGRDNVHLVCFADADGKVDLAALLQYLANEKECNEVLLESGAGLAGAMLKSGLIDEVITYIAPKLLGSEARPLFSLRGLTQMSDQYNLEITEVAMLGKDCRMRSRVLKDD